MSVRIEEGDCLSVMPTLDADSIDAIVTDPPYHLTTGKKGGSGPRSVNPESPAGRAKIGTGFMGKAWDGGDVAFRPETWAAALRVAKPGAHLVAFGGTRTFHRLTCAIEDAGWEIRDCLSWLYGSGFPKSHDVSKAIDKAAGHWRGRAGAVTIESQPAKGAEYERSDKGDPVTAAAAAAAAGWGTALKPAWEPIILARKPLAGTVAANWMEHGTGALNIDATRINFASADDKAAAAAAAQRSCQDQNKGRTAYSDFNNGPASLAPYLAKMDAGRWPANVVLDEVAAAILDEQSGEGVSRIGKPRGAANGDGWGMTMTGAEYSDVGGASRFFYTAKAGRIERNAGVEDQPAKPLNWSSGTQSPGTFQSEGTNRTAANNHPTVKPLALMQWLCRLVTPKGGIILDPFCGSGSTGRAAVAEGFSFIGIELDPEYAEIARARIADYAPLFSDLGAA